MNSFSSVTLVGRLTKNAEMKNTSGDNAVVRFSVAIDRRRKDNDEWKQDTSYIDVVYFGQSARKIVQYLEKGLLVGVVGELTQRRWDSQDGTKNSRVEVIASNVHLIESRNMREARGSQNDEFRTLKSQERQAEQVPPAVMNEPGPDDFDDDLSSPF